MDEEEINEALNMSMSFSDSEEDVYDSDKDKEYHPSSESSDPEYESDPSDFEFEPRHSRVSSETEELSPGTSESRQVDSELTWTVDDNVRNEFEYNPEGNIVGVNPDITETMMEGSPIDFFELFLDEDIMKVIVDQSNNYAEREAVKASSHSARMKKWISTTVAEMKVYFALVLWMGLMKLSSIAHYWSKSELYDTNFSKYMSRNRFELLTKVVHFCQEEPTGTKVTKVKGMIDLLVEKFNQCFQPQENMVIDESVVPFTGRLKYRQFIKNKRHRYGVKLFKLCAPPCYTMQMRIYAGKDEEEGRNLTKNVVMQLAHPYLNSGRTLYTDNFYTSIQLAHELNEQKTHLTGTLRANRKGVPKEIIAKKLKKGESFSLKSNKNVMVNKWRDKRDLLMLSTKDVGDMVDVQLKRNKIVQKPKVVVKYNKGKSAIDLSDQLASYSSPLRKSLKWFRKVAFDALFNVSLVNAHCLFTQVTGRNMSITQFRESIVSDLLKHKEPTPNDNIVYVHNLTSANKGRCAQCYKAVVLARGRKYAQTHSTKCRTKCLACNKHFCLQCFFKQHITKKK